MTGNPKETPVALAQRIAADPDAASASDKLRTIADYLDVDDVKHGFTGKDAQVFLRSLAMILEVSS